jgi:uroporphyrinogen-III synthase
VAALGRTPVLLPLLEISPLPDQASQLRRCWPACLVLRWSPSSRRMRSTRRLRTWRWPAGVPIAVVGEGSRAALARHGVTRPNAHPLPARPGRSDSEHLLQALDLALLAGRRVLVVRGESGRELMPDALRAAGAEVETVAGLPPRCRS